MDDPFAGLESFIRPPDPFDGLNQFIDPRPPQTKAREQELAPKMAAANEWAGRKIADSTVGFGTPGLKMDVNLGKEVGSETLGGRGISVGDILRRSVPFGSAFGLKDEEKTYGDAQKAYDNYLAGKGDPPTDTQLGQIAEHNQLQQRESSRSQKSKIASGLLNLPAIVGEFAAAAPLAAPARLIPGGTLAGRAAQTVAGAALSAPAMPSLWLEESQQRANKNGGDWYDSQNLAAPLVSAVVQNAILGQIAKIAGPAARQTTSSLLGRVGAKAAIGGAAMPIESEAGKLATDAASSLLDEAGFSEKYLTDKEGRYRLWKDMQNGQWGDVGTKLASDALMGAGFAAFHGKDAEPVDKFQDLVNDLKDKGYPKSKIVQTIQQDVGGLIADIKAGKDVAKEIQGLPEGKVRDYVQSVADSAKVSEKPTDSVSAPAEAQKQDLPAPAEPAAQPAPGEEIASQTLPPELQQRIDRQSALDELSRKSATRREEAAKVADEKTYKPLEDAFGEEASTDQGIHLIHSGDRMLKVFQREGGNRVYLDFTQDKPGTQFSSLDFEPAKLGIRSGTKDFADKLVKAVKGWEKNGVEIEYQAVEGKGLGGRRDRGSVYGRVLEKAGYEQVRSQSETQTALWRPKREIAQPAKPPEAKRPLTEEELFHVPILTGDTKGWEEVSVHKTHEEAANAAGVDGAVRVRAGGETVGLDGSLDKTARFAHGIALPEWVAYKKAGAKGEAAPATQTPHRMTGAVPMSEVRRPNPAEAHAAEKFGPDNTFRTAVKGPDGGVVGEATLAREETANGLVIHVPWTAATGLAGGEGRGVEPLGRKAIFDLAEQIAREIPDAKVVKFQPSSGRIGVGEHKVFDLDKVRDRLAKQDRKVIEPLTKEQTDATNDAIRSKHTPAEVAESVRLGQEAARREAEARAGATANEGPAAPDSQRPEPRPAEAGNAPPPATEAGAGADAGVGPAGPVDLFGRRTFTSNKGKSGTIEGMHPGDMSRVGAAEAYARKNGLKIAEKLSDGRFRVGEQWYGVGPEKDGFPVVKLDFKEDFSKIAPAANEGSLTESPSGGLFQQRNAEQPKPRGNIGNLKQNREAESLATRIRKSGGISEASAESVGLDVKAMKEMGGPSIFQDAAGRKSKRNIEDVLPEMVRAGDLVEVPNEHLADTLARKLAGGAKSAEGIESAAGQADIERKYNEFIQNHVPDPNAEDTSFDFGGNDEFSRSMSGGKRPKITLSASPARRAEGPKTIPDPLKRNFALGHDKTTAERAARGEPEVVKSEPRSDQELWDQADRERAADPDASKKIVDQILRGEPVDPDRAMPHLLMRKVGLQNAEKAARNELLTRQREKAPSEVTEPIERKYEDARASLRELELAASRILSKTGRGLRFARVLAAEDYTLDGMTGRATIEKKGPLDPKEIKEITDLHDRISDLEDRLDLYRNEPVEIPKPKTPQRSIWDRAKDFLTGMFKLPETKKADSKAWKWADRLEKNATEELVKKFGPDKLFSGFDPAAIPLLAKYTAAKIVKSGLTFSDFSKRITAKFGDEVKPHLDAIWSQAKKLASQPMDEKDLEIAINKEKNKYEEKIQDIKRKNSPLRQRLWAEAKETGNVVRLWETAADLSAVLRQGGLYTFGHPIKALTQSVPRMLNATLSEKAYDRRMYDLVHSPDGKFFTQNGGFLSEPGKMSGKEEAFLGRWLSRRPDKADWKNVLKLPLNVAREVVSGSERAYSSYLNEARITLFGKLRDSVIRNGRMTKEEAASLATFTNDWTGRATLPGGAEKSAAWLANFLFSPRYLWSRVRVLTGANLAGGTMATRKAIASEYARSAMGLALFYGAIQAADNDAKVEWDPRSSDFGKIRFGNFRLDPLTGLSQIGVFLTRTGTGEFKSSDTGQVHDLRKKTFGLRPATRKAGPFESDMKDVLFDFAANKAAPLPGIGLDVTIGRNREGEKNKGATGQQIAKQALVPISVNDVYDAMRDQGYGRGAALSLLAILGMGTQLHDKKK